MNDTAASAGVLDAEELLYLALHAMQQDRDEEAISCLKRGLLLEPQNGILHHLLGAIYAQLGMIDRAIAEMTQAVTFAPDLQMARFQLGLLHFTSINLAAAEEVWEPLAALPDDNPIALFRSGLLHLARDDYGQCVACLRRGIELNTEHPSLNRDMEAMAASAEQAATGNAPAQSAPNNGGVGRHVLLSGYEGLSSDQTKN